jgi:hypothetical protein
MKNYPLSLPLLLASGWLAITMSSASGNNAANFSIVAEAGSRFFTISIESVVGSENKYAFPKMMTNSNSDNEYRCDKQQKCQQHYTAAMQA